jgi:hypothetical protein
MSVSYEFDTSSLVSAFLGLMFGAGSIGALYTAATFYLDGTAPTAPRVLFPAVAGCVTFAITVGVITQTDWWTRVPPDDAPWKVREAWETARIPELTQSSKVIASVMGVATLGVGLALLGWHVASGTPPLFMVLFVLGGGLVMSLFSLRPFLRRWVHGRSTLVMDPMPARIGQTLEARLQTPISPDDVPDDGFDVRVLCGERTTGGRNSSPRIREEWSAEERVRGQRAATDTGVEVPLAFDLPEDVPPSTLERESERTVWRVEASADVSGLDYKATFEIPVVRPDRFN